MSFNSYRVLDGYAIDGYILADGYNNTFVTRWLDFHSSPFMNIKVAFSATGLSGTLTLEESDDRQATWTDGSVYPMSAQFNGVYGVGPLGDPIDLFSDTTLFSAQTVNSSTSLVYSFNSGVLGSRWVRLKYVATNSGSKSSNVTVTASFKSSS